MSKFKVGDTVVLIKDFSKNLRKGDHFNVVEECLEEDRWISAVSKDVSVETLNVGGWSHYFQLAPRKVLTPDSKFNLELTGRQLAKIYALLGKANGSLESDCWRTIKKLLDPQTKKYNSFCWDMNFEETRDYNSYEEEWLKVLFSPEETEQEKKIKALEETIAEASEQIRQLREDSK